MAHMHIIIERWIIVRFVSRTETKTPGRKLPPGERVLAIV